MENETKEEIFKNIENSIINYDKDLVEKYCKKVLELNIELEEVINYGLCKGLVVTGDLYEKEEYGIPELLVASQVFEYGMSILKPYLKNKNSKLRYKILICTVKGDVHSIGKNIVKLMLEVNGFHVVDLGVNIGSDVIIKEIKKDKFSIVALSSMMTTTLENMECIIKDVRKISKDIKFLVGGASVNEKIAKDFKADGYANNSTNAVKEALRVLDINY